MTELLRLQQKNQLSSEVTAEDMTWECSELLTHTVQCYTWPYICSCHTNLSVTRKRGTVKMKLTFPFCLKALGVWTGGLWWGCCQAASQAGETTILDRLNSSLESTVTLHLIYSVNVSNLLIMSRSLFQVWEVNTSMKMRDVEFKARRLLSSPEAAPPQFQRAIFDTFLLSV